MRKSKQILSWLLVLCMVLSLVPAIALPASAAIDSSAKWTETAFADIPDGATIIIGNTNNVAMPSVAATNAGPQKVSYTVSGSAGALTITPASGTLDEISWTVDKSGGADAVKFYQYGSTSVLLYLSGTSSNSAVRVNDGTSNNTFTMGDEGKLLKVTTASRYVGEYVAGSDWRSYNSETATNYSGQSLKFYVLNTDNGGSTGDTYELVTSTSGLVIGDTYIIAALGYDAAMSTTQNNNRPQVAITKDGNKISYVEGLQTLVLRAGTTSGTYAFDTGDGYLYAASSSNNYLKTQTTLNANGSWTIDVAGDGTATITAQGANTRNVMQYNNLSKLFACYASASQKPIALYRKVSGSTAGRYNLNYYVNGELYNTVTHNGTVTLGSAIYDDWYFLCWVNTEDDALIEGSSSYPTSGFFEGDSLTLNKDEDLYAVFYAYKNDAYTYTTRPGEDGAGDYKLVTSASELTLGGTYVIAALNEDYAMSITQNSNNRGQVAITRSGKTIFSVDGLQEVSLQEGTTSGTYAFYTGELGYLHAVSSSSNNLKTQTTLADNGSWTISVAADGTATIVAKGIYTRNKIQYNSSNKIFSCYAEDSTTQKAVALYRKIDDGTDIYKVNYYVGGEKSGNTFYTTGNVTLGTASFEDYEFYGWTTTDTTALQEGTTTAPEVQNGTVSVSANTDFYAVFTLNDTYTTRPVAGGAGTDTEASLLIVTGMGEVYFLRDGVKVEDYFTSNNAPLTGSVTEKGTRYYTNATAGETLTVVIKPATDYRLSCLEIGSNRCNPGTEPEQYSYDSTLGAYVCSFVVDNSAGQNAFRISFLPRVSDAGYTATQITGWDYTTASGLYVITGMKSPEDYTDNAHSTATTYLLYGDDDTALDDDREAIGRKSSALLLENIGVALNSQSPYLMTGLNECHIMEFTRYGATDFFTIRLFGATIANRYISAADSGTNIKIVDDYLLSATEVNKYALWRVTYLDNGAVQILNHGWEDAGTNRYLSFNNAAGNLQFRCYTDSTSSMSYPVLYGASKSSYQVNYSVTGSGQISAINTTSSATVASGTYQPAGNNITFTFTPAEGYELTGVTVNGTAVPLTGNTYTHTGLNEDINVVAIYEPIKAVNITVEYYLNNDLAASKPVSARSPYIIDSTVTVTYNGKTRPVSDFSFDQSVHNGAIYTDLNAAITVAEGDTIKAYFSTTAVDSVKTIRETTTVGASAPVNGSDNTGNFTTANGKDTNGNIKQTYDVTLQVSSNDMIEESFKGGNTDIIIILDNSGSMYPPDSYNAEYLTSALDSFADIIYTEGSNNRVAFVRYNYQGLAYSNTADNVLYNGSSNPNDYKDANGNVVFTYDSCFSRVNKQGFMWTVDHLLDEEDTGATNTMGGWKMAEVVARTRPKDTTRNLVVVMFTDGKPTMRYTAESGTNEIVNDANSSYPAGGIYTSTIEHNWAIDAAESLRQYIDTYSNCKSLIYNVALLNDTNYTDNDRTLVEYMMSAQSVKYWNYGTDYVEASNYIDNSTYWTTHEPYADSYIPIIGELDAEKQLNDIFTTIAYTTIPAKYVTGTITDIIPTDFSLTAESEAALTAAGWTITTNANGTTTISGPATATEAGTKLTYSVEYQGGGYGGSYTNETAYFTYYNLQTDEDMVAYFPLPVASVIPWTVNDHATTQLSTIATIDILSNDLFSELTDGGYTISSFNVTLTDENGNPTTYNDAVEQVGCGFDASVDPNSQNVTFYTENGGNKIFYYVVSAVATAPNGTQTTLTSRVTEVNVVVPNVELTKTAQDVTDSYAVTRDVYGNTQQVFLVTLEASTISSADVVTNGLITDTIPSGFAFVAFKETPNDSCSHSNNIITCTGISMDGSQQSVTLSYYIRYTGSGYGVLPTNASASFAYNFDGVPGITAQPFPVPYVALTPATVNDIDIGLAGESYILNIQSNDLYTTTTSGGYTVTPVSTILVDENGTPLNPQQIAALGISPVMNSDGSLSYTAPEEEGVTQFYYAVTYTATAPDGTTTTVTSRPTMVTLYTSKRTVAIVDFGLKTEDIFFSDYSGIYVDDAKTELLSNLVKAGDFVGNSFYGELAAENGLVSFQPKTMDFSGIATYDCTFTMAPSVYNANTAKTVTSRFVVLPANNLYFEEDFLEYVDSDWGNEGATNASTAQSAGEAHNIHIHGYDATYGVQETYSNGSCKSVTVSAGTGNYERTAYFTYTGTGFDIISSTNPNSGVMVAQIYEYDSTAENECGKLVKNILVDTWLKDASYDQIPVIAHRGDYGTYRVKVRAFYNAIFDHSKKSQFSESAVRQVLGLDEDTPLEISRFSTDNGTPSTKAVSPAQYGQYNVYLDAVRIYSPLGSMADETMSRAAELYAAAGEMNPVFTNVHDTLIGADNWNQNTEAGGFVYIAGNDSSTDGDGDIVYSGFHLGVNGQLYTEVGEDGRTYLLNEQGENVLYARQYPVYTANGSYFYEKNGTEYELTAKQVGNLGIAYYNDTYATIGPENEVYLKNGQGIAFAVGIDTNAQISLKIPYGTSSATLQMFDGAAWVDVATVTSRTEMYYRVNTDLIAGGLAILRCEAEDANTVLSVCNVKLSSSYAATTNSIRGLTMDEMVTAVNAFNADDVHEHSWSEWNVATPATCTEEGEQNRTCEACGETETASIAATGHTLETLTAVAPTCEEAGLTEGTKCSVCQVVLTAQEEIAATGHTLETLAAVAPTCEEPGLTEGTKCSVCQTVLTAQEEIPATGHSFGDWSVTTQPTCTEAGEQSRLCALCGKAETEAIDKLDCPSDVFVDVSAGSWYHNAVDFMVSKGYMNGVANDVFAPEETLNRAMVVTVLYRIAGTPEITAPTSFTDVPASEWYANAVAWAQAEGVVKGMSDTEFAPLVAVTREQIATILYRYVGAEAQETDMSAFNDAASISDWAAEAMAWAVAEGIFQGDDTNNLNPTANATRAEFATIIMRFLAN